MEISYVGKEFICPDCKEGFQIQEDIWQSQKERASPLKDQVPGVHSAPMPQLKILIQKMIA